MTYQHLLVSLYSLLETFFTLRMGAMSDSSEKSPENTAVNRTSSEKIIVSIGLVAGIFTIISGITPEITGWHSPSCTQENPYAECVPVTREVFGGIPRPVIAAFYFSVSVALICSFWLFAQRSKNYARGKSDNRRTTKDNVRRRIAGIYRSLSMRTLLRDRAAGLMHSCIYFGFLGLLAATTILEIDHQLPTSWKFLVGTTYKVYTLLSDLAGIVFLVGCLWAVYRRYIARVRRLASKTEKEDGFNIALLISLGVTGFVVEALRISVLMHEHRSATIENWSIVGFPLARIFDDLASANTLAIAHRWAWGAHIGLFLLFLIVLPATKLRHMVTSPVNAYLSDRSRPQGALTEMDNLAESEAESFGAGKIPDFTWKQLFDTDACTTCGRCTSVCPANLTGKVLDPRKIITSINEVMVSSGTPQVSPTVSTRETPAILTLATDDITSRVSAEEVFACTTCKACDNICPVNIEIMDKIVDIRRYYTLMESQFPSELGTAYRGMENQENPWGISQDQRGDWTKDLDYDVPIIDPAQPSTFTDSEGKFAYDVLYWVGCAGSFDDRAKKTTAALSGLLRRAGIRFAILASNEKCTGDPARRSGNEYIFQMLALDNINTLNTINPPTILTQCPHCFNTLKNEYKDFGGEYNVLHHTQYLLDLISSGALDISSATFAEKVTLHDSCYLTRHNDVVEEPRSIIGSIGGIEVVEMGRSKKNNLCCGAGGAQFFMEEGGETRVNLTRASEAQETGATTVISECPFCAVMLGDGIAALDENGTHAVVKDLAVVLAEALES